MIGEWLLIGARDWGSDFGLKWNTRGGSWDNSLTFGGFHYNDPRQIYGEVRYRFHF